MKAQTPDVPPRYRFRPRGDHYTFPAFGGEPRLDVERYEPLEWRELTDPTLIVSAVLTVLAAVLVLAYVFTS